MSRSADREGDDKAPTGAVPSARFAVPANLLGHQMAGFAAFSALTFGMASQAFGLWAGAVAGAAEAQRRLMEGVAERVGQVDEATVTAVRARQSHLELVSSQELPVAKPQRASPRAQKRSDPIAIRAEMAETAPASAGGADDLKAISGIGPKLEKVLNGLGIMTYVQVADLTASQIERLDADLGIAGRIERDGWIEQARRLGGMAG
jgi:NADH-quinone oxidoreductase subunit E